jgi:hypothetical protein
MNESDATLRFSVLETQESDAEDSQSASCSVANKGTTQRASRSRQKSLVLPVPKQGTTKAKQGTTKRTSQHTSWKCNKTHVATPVDNRKFPTMRKTRTGWCMGLLVDFDADRDHPYEIEWDCGESTMKAHVNANEMALLVQHYKGCKKRLLVDWFTVGLELLLITLRRSKVPEMKWDTSCFTRTKTNYIKRFFGTEQTTGSQARCWMTSSSLTSFIIWSREEELVHKSGTPKYTPRLIVMAATYCVRGIVPAALLQKKGLLGNVEPPKIPPNVESHPLLERLKRGQTPRELPIDDDDDDDFFETAQGPTLPIPEGCNESK